MNIMKITLNKKEGITNYWVAEKMVYVCIKYISLLSKVKS